MTETISANRIRDWIDDDLVEVVEQMPDPAAEFNYVVGMSNIRIHIIQRDPDGPVLVGQEIEYGEEIRNQIREMAEQDRNDLVARIRELLAEVPVVYGFHDKNGDNVRFKDVHRIFLEYRIYPDAASQQTLMDGLIDVWKAMRYLDDIVTLIDSEGRNS